MACNFIYHVVSINTLSSLFKIYFHKKRQVRKKKKMSNLSGNIYIVQ